MNHGGHFTGRQLGWTISGDAGLVATRLAAQGHAVWGVFNYVEDRANGSVLDRFFRRELRGVTYLGSTPPSDSILLIDDDGITFWLSDVGPALTCFKVHSGEVALPTAQIIYLDAYDWLFEATIALLDRVLNDTFKGHVIVNAGSMAAGDLDALLPRIEEHARSLRIILQLSLAKFRINEQKELKKKIREATSKALLTDGSRGLTLLWHGEEFEVQAKGVDGFCDASGAGAAASAALCELLMDDDKLISKWAAYIEDRGRGQCRIYGSLDEESWTALNSEFDGQRV